MPSPFSFPAAELFCFLGLPPRGLSSAVNQTALPRDVSAALRLLNMTERKSPVIPSEAEESRGNERGGLNLYLLSPRGGESVEREE